MTFSPDLAALRFGCGLSPVLAPPATPEALLAGLAGPDAMSARFPIEDFTAFSEQIAAARAVRETAKTRKDKIENQRALRRSLTAARNRWHLQRLLRWTWSETPLRERLTAFWADHFTVMGKSSIMLSGALPYEQSAIRPHVAGRFADLLIAVTTHPMMLHYLDQSASVGPGSRLARGRADGRGLNENLAREVLELHTLGVDGPYTQDDVRQLAELFTGLTYTAAKGFGFQPRRAEPGAETVLGKSYGGDPARLEPVLDALRDLAVHPATARHIARKLAVHFVSDAPDLALVDHVTARYLETGGDLMAVYGALIEHPAAWAAGPANIKPPLDYVASACRALAVPPERLAALEPRRARRLLIDPLAKMGQPLFRPRGPDGWAEEDAAWITPQAVSARLLWALSAPSALRPDLPEPRSFVDTTLGAFATEPVRFAAASAESRADAVGLVLSAPAFQRR